MIYVILAVLGLCLGSFINALIWRLHEQGKKSKASKKGPKTDKFSITKGRSMCPHCQHELTAKDLIPVFSWLALKGKCRYCHKSISRQYPLIELLTAGLFVASYMFWPENIQSFSSGLNFAVWLVVLAGFVALVVYDLKWMLLPNRIIYPLILLVLGLAVFNIITGESLDTLYKYLFSTLVAGGLFYLLFFVSGGRWIGGGDVKLGLLIGLVLADPYQSFLMLLLASLLGTVLVLPGMLIGKVTPKSRIPFGPFLILAALIVKLFGAAVIEWYKNSLVI